MKLIRSHLVRPSRFGFLIAILLILTSCSKSPTDPAPTTALKDWRVAWEPVTTSQIRSITNSEKIIIAVGDNGLFLYSVDGVDWSRARFSHSLNTEKTLNFIRACWTGERFVAVTNNGDVAVSTNGMEWQGLYISGAQHFADIAANSERIVIFTYLGEVFYSDNGAKWEHVEQDFETRLYSVIWDGRRFVGCGQRSGVYYSEEGNKWTFVPSAIDSLTTINSIAFNGEFYLATVRDRARSHAGLYRSMDGEHWEGPTDVGSRINRGITWNGHEFAISGSSQTLVSSDGTNWEPVVFIESPYMNHLQPDAANLRRFAGRIVASGSRGILAYSNSEFQDWNMITGSGFFDFADVAHGDLGWVAVGALGLIMTSSNGYDWKQQERFTNVDLSQVLWNGSAFVTTGDTSLVFVSTDGEHWNKYELGEPRAWSHKTVLAIQDSVTVAVVNQHAYFTTDSENWIYNNKIAPYQFLDLKYTNGKWIGVGARGRAAWSSDFSRWQRMDIINRDIFSTPQDLTSINWSGSEYLATGKDGAMMISTDLENWTYQRQFYGQLFSVNDALWTGEEYLIVGGTGMVITTNDLENWINHYPPVNDQITAVATDGTSYITVSQNKSRIMISP